MAIGITKLTCCINADITNCTFTPLELAQLSGMQAGINATCYSVANIASLPPAANNTGRLVYIRDIKRYRYSDGTQWSTNFESEFAVSSSSAWSWGWNSGGLLGDNTTTDKSSPISVVGGFTNWSQVNVGVSHTVALRTNGTLWSWGQNSFGQLGNNTNTSSSSPVSVVGDFSNWCQISAGGTHSLGITTNCTLWAWGNNTCGQLGDNTTTAKSSPVSVIGGFNDWCQASAGYRHSIALRTNGTLWSWGSNCCGRLGDGSSVSRSSPVSVVGGFTDWCQVSAGYHSLAIRTNGTMWAWGPNGVGYLGDNTNVAKSSPVSVVGGFTNWCQTVATGTHSIGLRNNGTLWAWGYNTNGELGDNTTTNRSSPVSVVGGFTDWCRVDGTYHTVAIRTNGTLWGWGVNGNGKIGDGTTTNRSSPVSIIGGYTDWFDVSTGGEFTVALRGTTKGFR